MQGAVGCGKGPQGGDEPAQVCWGQKLKGQQGLDRESSRNPLETGRPEEADTSKTGHGCGWAGRAELWREDVWGFGDMESPEIGVTRSYCLALLVRPSAFGWSNCTPYHHL